MAFKCVFFIYFHAGLLPWKCGCINQSRYQRWLTDGKTPRKQVGEENKESKVSRRRRMGEMNVCDQKNCDVLQTNRAPVIMWEINLNYSRWQNGRHSDGRWEIQCWDRLKRWGSHILMSKDRKRIDLMSHSSPYTKSFAFRCDQWQNFILNFFKRKI